MKTRFSIGCWLMGVVALLAAGAGGWWFMTHRGGADDKKEAADEPTAAVQVSPLHRGPIERTLAAYGTVTAAPGGTRSVSFPFESRIVAVQVNLGQTVAAGDALLQIEPSVDARLALDTARGAQKSADKALQDTQERFKARLATNTELAAAESAARDARLKLDSLQARVPDATGIVKATDTGVVTKLPAGPGTVVAPGGPLVEIAVAQRFEARLGIAPADVGEVKVGQAVHLTPVQASGGGAAALQGTLRVVGASIDPATHLVDAFVALADSGTPMLIGTYLRAEIVVERKDALLAPRAAVLPQEGGDGGVIFTVDKDKVVKHEVKTGIDDGANVEILDGGNALADGTPVVTEGNSELEDKGSVEVGKADAGKETEKEGGKPGEDKTP